MYGQELFDLLLDLPAFCELIVNQTFAAGACLTEGRTFPEIPAGFGMAAVGRALHALALRTFENRPTGDQREDAPDPLNADLLDVDRVPDTSYPFDIPLRVQTMGGFRVMGEDKPFPFVHPECMNGDTEKACRRTNGIQWHICRGGLAHRITFSYHRFINIKYDAIYK